MILLSERGWAGLEGKDVQGSSVTRPLFFSSCGLVQLEQSEAKCEDALKTQKALTADLESMHSELENVTRNKSLVLVPSLSEAGLVQLSELVWAYCVLVTIRGTRALIMDLLGTTLKVQISIVDLLDAQHSESAASYYELSIIKM